MTKTAKAPRTDVRTEADQRKALNVTYLYSLTSFGYYVVFAPIFIFYAHKLYFGLVHLLCAFVVGSLALHAYITKKVELASYGVITLAALVVLAMVFEGGIDHSGIYFVLPVAILLFFLPSRRYSLFWIGAMLVVFVAALGLALLGQVTLPYTTEDFSLFIASYTSSVALLVMYAREKDKLDRKLDRSLDEIRLLARSLEQEKARVEEKVQIRTQQYRKEHAKLEASIDSIKIGFIILDHSLSVLSINSAAKRILLSVQAKSNEDIPPDSLSMTEIVSRLSGTYDLVAKVKSSMHHKKTISARDVHLGSRYLAITITPVLDGAVTIGAVVLLEDTTDSKALERSRDEFFSIASHELRTPLTAIVGNASIAKDYYEKLGDKEVKGMLTDINSSGKRLISIVNDFLDVSSLEQNHIKLKNEPVDLLKLVKEIVDETEPLARVRHNAVSIAPAERAAHVILQTDRDRLKQIIINLVGNAIKYTESGTITVSIEKQKNHTVTIRVEDTGTGIPRETQYLLFRKFQQASPNILTRDNSQSTGLGLYISNMLAKTMGGEVFLEHSEPGVGSIFAVRLPLDQLQ